MTNPKVPTPIVDKNGKQTTVHRSADKPVKGGRDIPRVTHGVSKKSPIDKLHSAMKRAGLPKDSAKLSVIVRSLGSGSIATAGDRYDSFVRLVGKTYDLDQPKAKAAANAIYTAVGMGDGIKETVHRDVLNAAARKTLVANHKIRFPRQGEASAELKIDEVAERNQQLIRPVEKNLDPMDTDVFHNKNMERAAFNESLESIAEKQPELIDAVAVLASIEPEKRTTLGSINALLAATETDKLDAIKAGLEYHGIDTPVDDLYALYHVATYEGITPEARDKAFDMVLGVNNAVIKTLGKNLDSI